MAVWSGSMSHSQTGVDQAVVSTCALHQHWLKWRGTQRAACLSATKHSIQLLLMALRSSAQRRWTRKPPIMLNALPMQGPLVMSGSGQSSVVCHTPSLEFCAAAAVPLRNRRPSSLSVAVSRGVRLAPQYRL